MPGVANSPGRVQAKPEWCDVSTWPSIARGWGCWVDLKVYMGILYQVGDDPWRQTLRLVFPLQLRKRPIHNNCTVQRVVSILILTKPMHELGKDISEWAVGCYRDVLEWVQNCKCVPVQKSKQKTLHEYPRRSYSVVPRWNG